MAAAARPATARAAMERAVAAPHVHTRTGPQARARHTPQSALRRARRRPTGPQLAHVPHILIDLPEAGRPGGPPPTQRHAPLLPTVWWQQWSRKDGSARRARARRNDGHARHSAHHWKHHEANVLSEPEITVVVEAEHEKCTCEGCWHANVRGGWQHTFSTRRARSCSSYDASCRSRHVALKSSRWVCR